MRKTSLLISTRVLTGMHGRNNIWLHRPGQYFRSQSAKMFYVTWLILHIILLLWTRTIRYFQRKMVRRKALSESNVPQNWKVALPTWQSIISHCKHLCFSNTLQLTRNYRDRQDFSAVNWIADFWPWPNACMMLLLSVTYWHSTGHLGTDTLLKPLKSSNNAFPLVITGLQTA